MKSAIKLICTALFAGLFALPAAAQMGAGMGGMGPGMSGGGMGGMAAPAGKRGPRDCVQAPNPEQCKARQEARQKAAEACKDKAAGPDRRQCMRDSMPPKDCSKAPSPERCNTMQKAHETCRGKTGPERRQCMSEAKIGRAHV